MSDTPAEAPAAPSAPATVPAKSRRARSLIVRIVVGAAVVGGGIYWWTSRDKPGRDPSLAAPSGGGGGGGGMGRSGAGGGSDRTVPVAIAVAATEDLPIWLEGLGSVIAAQQVTVKPQVDGPLMSLEFTEGQTVKQGDVIAKIDPRPFLVRLHTAEGALARDRATLAANKANLARFVSLRAQNLVAQNQVDDLKGQVGQNEGLIKIDLAAIEDARLQLEYANVRAPATGVTGVRLVDAGNVVRANTDGIVMITAIDPAAVIFTVPQDRLTAVAAAQAKGEVTVEIFGRDDTKKLATGKLTVIDNQINQQTATLRLKAMVPNPDRVLWPNAFVKVRMLIEERTGALVIPAVAIQRGPQGTFVYVVRADDTAQMAPVVVALQTGDKVVIQSGIAVGDRVVVEGQNQLRPGGKVSIAGAKQDGAGSGSGRRGRDGAGSAGSGSSSAPSADGSRRPAAGSGGSAAATGSAAPHAPTATARVTTGGS